MHKNKLPIILGATASGKTRLAVQIAQWIDGEIMSADSRQVFVGMDIGTGKDLEVYQINGKTIPYHLIDVLPSGESYNVNRFKEDFYTAFTAICLRNKQPILCGGTGMYIHSLLVNQAFTSVPIHADLRKKLADFSKNELVEKLATYPEVYIAHADVSSSKRLIRAIEIADFLMENELPNVPKADFNPMIIGLKNDRTQQRKNILHRLKTRLQNGLIEEVERLVKEGISYEKLIFYGLEYKFVSLYLLHQLSYSEMEEKLGIAICQFAKRQETFFRKMEKDGVKINWLDASSPIDTLVHQALDFIG